MSASRIELRPDEVRALGPWRMPPENQGQMVEVDYAADEAYVYERSFDRSTRTTSFRRRPWRQDDETYIGLNYVPKGFDARRRASKRSAPAPAKPFYGDGFRVAADPAAYRVIQDNGHVVSRHRTLSAARKELARELRRLARWKNEPHGANRNAWVSALIINREGKVVS